MMKKFSSLSSGLRKALWIFLALCAGLTLLDVIVAKHGNHWWGFFGFYSLYGFVACVILVIVAKGMRRFLMKDEDYYDD